ncbi:MAG: GDP-mannose 4,6-dehydratase [Candidatus Eiseniibacteriota bacterium]|jgi:GDP-4-dehydro-6-deoxy-D-mannose reductase
MSLVLVTGAAGFVGRHLMPALVARGHTVLGADLDGAGGDREAAIRRLDITEADAVTALVDAVRPEAIIHLAAMSSAGASFGAPRASYVTNGEGAMHVLEAVRHRAPSCRLLMVSSAEVYGPCAAGQRHDESAALHPVSPYGVSKALADRMTEQYGRAYGLDEVRVRPFSHTGPGQAPTFVWPAFARQVAAIEAGRAAPVLRVGRLDVERDYSDVRDVVACYCEILERSGRGQAWNVCAGRGERLETLLQGLLRLARVDITVETDPARLRPVDLPRLVGDPGRVERELGWRPSITMEETLADLLEEARARESTAGRDRSRGGS